MALNQQANIHFSVGKGTENHELGTGFFFVCSRNVLAVKRG
jgi:hypothetical protein